MYWVGKTRGYAVAAIRRSQGRLAEGRAGTWLRLEKKTDAFTELSYLEAVDGCGHRARVGIRDSQELLQKRESGQLFFCYYVKEQAPGQVILLFCTAEEVPEDENSALLFEMPESYCVFSTKF